MKDETGKYGNGNMHPMFSGKCRKELKKTNSQGVIHEYQNEY
jgi:hypothetical protein